MVREAREGLPERLTHLYNACLCPGHHLPQWHEATVVVIPESNRALTELPFLSAARTAEFSLSVREIDVHGQRPMPASPDHDSQIVFI